MKLLESLLDAIVRLEGDALVMHVGEKPYVITASASMNAYRGPLAWGQVELSSRVLTLDAVSSMLAEILPADQRRALDEFGAIEHEVLPPDGILDRFTVIAARGGEDVWVEVRRKPTPAAVPDSAPVAEEPADVHQATAPAAAEEPSAPAVQRPEEAHDAGAPAMVTATEAESGVEPEPDVVTPASAEQADQSSELTESIVVALPGEESENVSLDAVPDDVIQIIDEEAQDVPTEEEVDAMLAATASALLTSGLGAEEMPEISEAMEFAVDEIPAEVLTSVDPEPETIIPEPETVRADSAAFELSPPPPAEHVEPEIPEHAEPVSPEGTPLFTDAAIAAAQTQPDAHEEHAQLPEAPVEDLSQAVWTHALTEWSKLAADVTPHGETPAEAAEIGTAAEPESAPEPVAASEPEPEAVNAPEPEPEPVAASEPVEEPDPVLHIADAPAPDEAVTAIVDAVVTEPEPVIEEPVAPVAEPEPTVVEPVAAAPEISSPAAPIAPQSESEEEQQAFVEEEEVESEDAGATFEAPVFAPPPSIDPSFAEMRMEASPESRHEVATAMTDDRRTSVPAHMSDGTADSDASSDVRSGVVVPLARKQEPVVPYTPAEDAALTRTLRAAAAAGAATVYVVAQSKPMVRIDGDIKPLESEPSLTAEDVERLVLELLPPRRRDAVQNGPVEWLCDIPGIGRVRCLTFRDHRGPGVLFRMFPSRAISADQLALTPEVQALCQQPDGLVLVTGARASGKSTLLNAFVDLINRTRSDHVITIESQIGFVHESRRSFISQRETRGDNELAASVARAALREDPDVLMIEELKSADLVSAALEAAESGRLVLASVPAASTIGAIERLIELFPSERRARARASLATALRGVIAQVLLRRVTGGRAAAREILLNTPAVSTLVMEGKMFQLPVALDSGRRHGMLPLTDSLAAFVREGTVHPGEAYRKALDRAALIAALKRDGVDTSFAERMA